MGFPRPVFGVAQDEFGRNVAASVLRYAQCPVPIVPGSFTGAHGGLPPGEYGKPRLEASRARRLGFTGG